MTAGVELFVGDLDRLGITAQVAGDLVVYDVEPVEGTQAGTAVSTGVSISELLRWPVVPPHWVHLPRDVRFQRTNTQGSPREGWVAHSRNLVGWGTDQNPARAWVAHVRSVIGEATA